MTLPTKEPEDVEAEHDERVRREQRELQCDQGRLNIGSVDRHGHGFTRCVLPRGHTDEHTMAESLRVFHAAQGNDLGPWQTAVESKDLANEIRDRLGIPRVDYDGGTIDPDVKRALFGDGAVRPGEAVTVGQADSLDAAMAILHGIGKPPRN